MLVFSNKMAIQFPDDIITAYSNLHIFTGNTGRSVANFRGSNGPQLPYHRSIYLLLPSVHIMSKTFN